MTLTFEQYTEIAYQQEFEKLSAEERRRWQPGSSWDVRCFGAAAELYAEAKAKEFAEWYSKLTPTQKITVHPPAGGGGSTGIYEMTIEQLYETFKQKK